MGVREGLSEKLTFEQRFERGEGIGRVKTGNSFPGRDPTKYKPQGGALLNTRDQCGWGRAIVWPDMSAIVKDIGIYSE